MSAARKLELLRPGTEGEALEANSTGAEPESEPEEIGSEYLAVPHTQVLARDTAIADLFVKLRTGKMIKVAHKGALINKDQIERLASKDVDRLYVLADEFKGVVGDLLAKARSIHAGKSSDMAVQTYFQVAESVLTEVVSLPVGEDSIERAVEVSNEISESLVKATDLSKGMKLIFTLGEMYGRHAMGTVVFSNWIAQSLGWRSPKILSPLTLGALLHDVGKREIPNEILAKSRADMTFEEMAIYETHATRGAMILSQFKNIPGDVIRVVQEHHEIPNGQGFPARLRGERIFPLAKVVSLANLLSHDLIDAIAEKRQLDIQTLIDRIEGLYKSMYGAELSKAVRRIFKRDGS